MRNNAPLILAFDNGGLLVNSEKAFLAANKKIFNALSQILKKYGFDSKQYTKAEFIYHNILTSLGTKGYLREKNIPEPLIHEIKTYRNKIFETIISEKKEKGTWAIGDRIEQLKALKNKFKDRIKLVLVTTSSKQKIMAMHMGIIPLNLFDQYITKDDLKDPSRIKPFPDLYKLVTEKFPYAKKYLAFEDTPRGAESVINAQNNGVPYVIPNEITKNVPMPKGVNIIDFEDIMSIVENELSTQNNWLKRFAAQPKKILDWIKTRFTSQMRFILDTVKKYFKL